MAECGGLLKKIYWKFLKENFNEEFSVTYSDTLHQPEHYQMGLQWFFFAINSLLVLFAIIIWIFLRRFKINEVINEPPNEKIDTDNNDEAQTLEFAEQTFVIPQSEEMLEDLSVPCFEDQVENSLVPENVEMLEDLSMPCFEDQIETASEKSEAQDEVKKSFESSKTSDVSAITSIYENLTFSASTTNKLSQKPSKNFLNINIQKVKQKSEMRAQSARQSGSGESVGKARPRTKTSIPVRVPSNSKTYTKLNDETEKNKNDS